MVDKVLPTRCQHCDYLDKLEPQVANMRLLSELRSWGNKIKTSSKTSPRRFLARKNTKLDRVDSFHSDTSKPIRVFRIGRCYICFGWSRSRVETVTTYDATIDYSYVQYCCSSQSAELSGIARSELPDIASHHQPQIQELPTESSPQELSDRASTASAVLEKDAIYELDSSLPVEANIRRLDMACEDMSQFNISYFSMDKQEAPQMHKMMHQTLPRLTTMSSHLMPRSFEEYSIDSLRLTSANNSMTPSPVSPVTPELENMQSIGTRQPLYVSPISTAPSPHRHFPSFLQHGAFDAYDQQYFYNEAPQAVPQDSFTSASVESSGHDEMAHGSWMLDTYHNSYSLPEMSLMDQGFAAPSDLGQRPRKRRSLDFGRDLAWEHWTNSGDTSSYLDAVEKSGNSSNPYNHDDSTPVGELEMCSILDSQEQEISQDISDTEHTRPQAVKRYPKEGCEYCGKEFTGRYGKGNLARHIREKHGLENSMIGKVCRVCKQAYNRADAKRKHEWKKHRLIDVKPNKRRKKHQ